MKPTCTGPVRISRRRMLQIGAAGMLGLSLPKLLGAEAAGGGKASANGDECRVNQKWQERGGLYPLRRSSLTWAWAWRAGSGSRQPRHAARTTRTALGRSIWWPTET